MAKFAKEAIAGVGAGMGTRVSARVDTRVGTGLSGRRWFDDLFHLFEELETNRFSNRKTTVSDRVLTSMMIANGTQQATAQEIPTKLTIMMAYLEQSASSTKPSAKPSKTLTPRVEVTKKVIIVKTVNNNKAPIQIVLYRTGRVGNLIVLPFLAAWARHS
jgi:hypothetical protein